MSKSLPPVYLINLPRATSRRKMSLEQLNKLGIKPKFVAAHDGHSPTFPFHKYKNLLNPFWGRKAKFFKPGAFACYLSHAECWKKIAKGDSSFGLILEDDIILNNKAFTNFDLTRYKCDFDVLFVNQRINKWLKFIEEKYWENKDLVSLNDVLIEALTNNQFTNNVPTPGGDGYIVSKKGASKLLEMMKLCKIDMSPDYAIVLNSITPEGMEKINSLPKNKLPNNLLYFVEKRLQKHSEIKTSYLYLNSLIYSGEPLVRMANQKEYPSNIDHSKRKDYNSVQESSPYCSINQHQHKLKITEGKVISSNYDNKNISFFVTDDKDIIQKYHLQGKFYGIEDLEIIASTISKPSIILDIGSNIGNHTIYFAKIMKAEKVICIEPNPVAINVLKINANLNDCSNVDLSYLGIGFSDSINQYKVDFLSNNNIRSANLIRVGQNETLSNSEQIIPFIPGDSLHSLSDINLIKISVNGMEFSVIKGLEKTIYKCKPLLFINIIDTHVEQVMEYLSKLGYFVIYQNKQHILNTNYLLMYEDGSMT